ncbi:MAG: hypothetical protein OEW60_00825 [Thiovulaceae bacterium]|nr:hypothetical protein [Sulfurimonadaceae bacterium]
MKHNIFMTLIIFLLPLHAVSEDNTTQNFEKLTVEGKDERDAFSVQDYIKSQTFLQDAPSQRQLSIEEAMDLPGVQGDPVKAVKLLAGVTSTGSSGELIIHASKPSETLSTINYLPLGYLFHMQGLHSVISPEATEQLNIYLGGFDNSYNNAMGGVLDITPKYPMGDNSGHIHIGIFDSSFGFDAKITDDTSIYIGGRRSYFDLFVDDLTFSSDDNNASATLTQFPRYWDGTLLLTHRAGNHQFSLESIGAQDSLGIVIDGNVQDPQANGDLDIAQGFISNGLRWLYDNGDNYQSNTLLYYMYSYARLNLFAGQKVNIDQHDSGIKHISTFEHKKHKISTGIYLDHFVTPLDINASQEPSPDDINTTITGATIAQINETLRINLATFFVQDVYTLSDAWTLRYGVSYVLSDYQQLTNNLDPRAAIIYRPNDRHKLSFAAGQYSQTPQGSRLLQDIGNPDLSFEKSNHLTLSYAYNFSDDSSIEIEPYYKTFENLAVSDTSNDANNTKNYLSVGEGEAFGSDITFKYRTDNAYILATYTYVDTTRQLYSADPTLYTFYGEIPHTLNVIGSYKFNDRWSLSTLVKYQSGKPYTPVIGTTTATDPVTLLTYTAPLYGEPFSQSLNDYFSLNVKVSYKRKTSLHTSWEYSFEVMNATNHKNELGISYNDDYTKEIRSYDLGIIPWFDVTYRF